MMIVGEGRRSMPFPMQFPVCKAAGQRQETYHLSPCVHWCALLGWPSSDEGDEEPELVTVVCRSR
jgi:hypothetical protein